MGRTLVQVYREGKCTRESRRDSADLYDTGAGFWARGRASRAWAGHGHDEHAPCASHRGPGAGGAARLGFRGFGRSRAAAGGRSPGARGSGRPVGARVPVGGGRNWCRRGVAQQGGAERGAEAGQKPGSSHPRIASNSVHSSARARSAAGSGWGGWVGYVMSINITYLLVKCKRYFHPR